MTENILIINGNDPGREPMDQYISELIELLQEKNMAVEELKLAEMNIRSCKGCWDCWVKTPGICSIKDDQEKILEKAIHAGLVIFASPMIMGFPSAKLKLSMERFIPLLHPNINIIQNESHHSKRYPSYPRLGMLLQEEEDGDDEDLQIVRDIMDRYAINFMSEIVFFETTTKPTEQIRDEISRL